MSRTLDAAALRALLALALVGFVAAAAATAERARTRSLPGGAAERFVPRLARFPLDEVGVAAPAPLVAFAFTSRLCAPCRETPALVASAAPGVPLVPLPVERHAGLARRLGVDETPTLLLVDAEGRVRYASRGNPGADELREAVARAARPPP